MERQKLELHHLRKLKEQGEKLTMLTAYDHPTAKMLDEEGIDLILVGDSVANVVLGYTDTRPVTMEEMLHHTRAVVRGVHYALVIGDMPFMSYNISREEAVRNAGRFLKETGCDMVKLEGAGRHIDTIADVVSAGIPVCGHLGLTPQTASLIGGYRVQGRTSKTAARLVRDSKAIEDAGASLLVLECVPMEVSHIISSQLRIPVIGIGAGEGCDGQVLVFHDIMGIQSGFTPRFVKRYTDVDKVMREAVQAYRVDVKGNAFPTADHSFTMPAKSLEKLEALLAKGAAGTLDGDSAASTASVPPKDKPRSEAKLVLEKALRDSVEKTAIARRRDEKAPRKKKKSAKKTSKKTSKKPRKKKGTR